VRDGAVSGTRIGAAGHRIRRLWRAFVAQVEARPRTAVAVTFLIAAIPIAFLGSYVAQHGVDVPYMDDWEIAPVIAKAHTGELTFSDFFTQEEEARMIVPKLIFVASTWKGHWDVRAQMMLSVAICVVTAVGIYVLLRRSGLGVFASAICFWLAVLLIFSPAQFELWLFASGFPSFLPVLLIVAALLLFETSLPAWVKFIGAAALSLLSSFTLAHGLLAWGLTFPVYLVGRLVRRWQWWAGAWCAAAAVCAVAYLYGYSKPAHLPEFAPVILARDYAQFFLTFLGGSFAFASRDHRVALATAVGAVVLTMFLAALVYALVRRRDDSLLRRSLPWFALGFYSLGSGTLATLGRVGFGIEYATSSRYVTFSLYLIVAVIGLAAVLGSDALRRTRSGFWRVLLPTAVAALLLIGAQLFAESYGRSMRILDSAWARNRLARTAVLFSPVIDTSGVVKRINYPAAEVALARAALLDRLGLLRQPLVKTREISELSHARADGEVASGRCDSLAPLNEEQVRASGWAALRAKGRPADAVVFAYETAGQPPVIFAISDEATRRRDIARKLRSPKQLWTGWTATFPRAAVPAGASISAWGVDADGPVLYRLRQDGPELKL